MHLLRDGMIGLALMATVGLAPVPAMADGGPRVPYDDAAYPALWQGLYAGVHLGFGDGSGGVLGGGQVGYNWQSGRVVYGLEADFALSSIEEEVRACSGFACAHARASLDWMATVRGRIGDLIDPRVLAYATAGIGITSWSAEAGITGCAACSVRLDGTETDFIFGLGIEGKITETMSARIEFLTGNDLEVDV